MLITRDELNALYTLTVEGYRRDPQITLSDLNFAESLLTKLQSYNADDDFNEGVTAAQNKLLDMSISTQDQGLVLVLRAIAQSIEEVKK